MKDQPHDFWAGLGDFFSGAFSALTSYGAGQVCAVVLILVGVVAILCGWWWWMDHRAEQEPE